jgi:hypothetical protein
VSVIEGGGMSGRKVITVVFVDEVSVFFFHLDALAVIPIFATVTANHPFPGVRFATDAI